MLGSGTETSKAGGGDTRSASPASCASPPPQADSDIAAIIAVAPQNQAAFISPTAAGRQTRRR
jgi:hypothetical protein